MRKSQIVKALGSVAVAAGLVAASAAPASALASVGLAPSSCGYWYDQTCAGYAQDVIGVGSGSDVAVACDATSRYSVQITIVQCYIEGNNGDQHYSRAVWTQGQTSALTETFPAWSLQSRAYRVCVGAGYVDTWGNVYLPDGYSCGASV